MRIDQLIGLLFSLAFNLVFYAYLVRLDNTKCGCGKDDVDRRGALIQSTVITCILVLGRLLFTTTYAPPLIVGIFMLHFDFVSAVSSYRYLRDIRDHKCKCSQSTTRDMYYFYYMASACLLGLVLSLFYFTLALLTFK